jgi:hypothetical protein
MSDCFLETSQCHPFWAPTSNTPRASSKEQLTDYTLPTVPASPGFMSAATRYPSLHPARAQLKAHELRKTLELPTILYDDSP